MSQLSEIYKTYSNTALLRIVQTPADYRPEAVEAAQKELDSRQLLPIEIEEAKIQLEAEDQELISKREKRDKIKNTLAEKGTGIIDYINPVMDENAGEDNRQKPPLIINTIAIVFLIISILQIVTQFYLLKGLFDNGKWDFSVVLFLFPIIVTPLASILFWMKKRSGWILLAIYLGFAVMGMLWMLFISFDSMFLVGSLFFTGTLWCICQEKIREVFNISIKQMYYTILLSIAIMAIILVGYFFAL
ncbi:hypothetical protein [Prevotella sp. 10(H)]|uniref:hypothetical protein n=1 Tax=Prevotella sp. 10(H) TaxID=1158294 RepID=UPI0004A754D1|nr:hypothetical protein [Prevotella sp. 10(H)]